MEKASSKTSMAVTHPVVNSSNKAAEQMRTVELSSIMPCAHVVRSILIRSLNPWWALRSCKLDGWHLNGLYETPLPKQDRICIARLHDSELLPLLLESSISAYQKYKRGAFN